MNGNETHSILIVDDEVANLRLVIEILRDYGFDLMTALTGKEGLISAREGRPDIILLDILMPGLDGYAVRERLQADPATRDIPVIFLTALTETESKLRAFQLGAVDYIVKPIDPREVLARVILHLNQRRLVLGLQSRLEAHARAELMEPVSASPASLARSLAQVADHLRENLAHTPSLDELARIAATNRTQLNRDFQCVYGMSVFDWLREQRLLRAAALLRTTARPVADIAGAVGYTSHAGFIGAFRQRFKLSPREYRAAAASGESA